MAVIGNRITDFTGLLILFSGNRSGVLRPVDGSNISPGAKNILK